MKQLSIKVIGKWLSLPFILLTTMFGTFLIGALYFEELKFVGLEYTGILVMVVVLYFILFVLALFVTIVRYYSYGYEITDTHLLVSKGIIHKHTITVPHGNIQEVEKEQDILDRIFGVCTIKVETAGIVSANVEIPGIDVMSNLHDRILEYKNKKLKEKTKLARPSETLLGVEKAVILLSDEISALRVDFNQFIEKLEDITKKESVEKRRLGKTEVVKKTKKKDVRK